VYPGVPFDTYARWKAIGMSTLEAHQNSDRHAWEYITNPPESKPHQELGSAAHAAIFEPEAFVERYACAPVCDRRTKAGKETWAAFVEENSDKSVLPQPEYDQAVAIAGYVQGDSGSVAYQLTHGRGLNEVSIVWDDPETGVQCKCRPDRIADVILPGAADYRGYPVLVDAKTISRRGRRGKLYDLMARDCGTWGYHTRAAWYLDALDALAPVPRRHVILALEIGPVVDVIACELSVKAIRQGRREYRRLLQRHLECLDSGQWRGASRDLEPIDPPAWVFDPEL